MRVLLQAPFPLLAARQPGGAQAAVAKLLPLLAREVELTVACPPLAGPPPPLGPGVAVVDELLAVEDPHASAAALSHDLALLDRLAAAADVVVTVDEPFPLPTPRPVVLWLNSLAYGPELRSVFGLGWDAVVVPSAYSQRRLHWYFGSEAWVGRPRSLVAIPHGVTIPAASQPEALASLRRSLGVPAGARCLTFPHRSDPGKGFDAALAAVEELRRRGGEYLLLVPIPSAADLYPHQREEWHRRLRAGEGDGVLVHRWIEPAEMPTYLRLGEWTLAPSELDESFFLTPLESVAAGVPAIATPAGALPELLPPGLGATTVEFGDHLAIADAVAAGPDPDAVARGRAHLAGAMTWEAAAARWLELLRTVRKSEATFVPSQSPPDTTPPWLRRLPSGRVWDDVRRAYVESAVPAEVAR